MFFFPKDLFSQNIFCFCFSRASSVTSVISVDRPQDGKFQSFSGGRAMAVNGVQTSGIALAGAPRAASAPQGQIREEFPETWIWESAIAE